MKSHYNTLNPKLFFFFMNPKLFFFMNQCQAETQSLLLHECQDPLLHIESQFLLLYESQALLLHLLHGTQVASHGFL
ncbi:unnamed protein product [Sphagnum troendelagicum]|uniref:Uncharacterized protein n=1 Tax=Sphagnum troendelagicum TaxID=128251 RepID=A0ABP0TSR1_9BRYO